MANTVWTEEMVAIAAGMKRAGISAKKIAERLGIAERAVAIKMSRKKVKTRLTGTRGGNSKNKIPFKAFESEDWTING